MNTLTSPAVTSLLDRLFADADQTDSALRRELAARTPADREAFMARAQTDYRSFYGDARSLYLPVSRETGRLLYVLARTHRARAIVEYGTSFGLSTLHLAAALRDNGGGTLIGSELEPTKAERARMNLKEAGLSEGVDIRVGDALETLARDLPATIDLVLLDGAKLLYPRILKLLEPHLGPGALVVADNADDSPAFVAHVRDPANGYVSVPFASDVELSMKL